MQRRLRKVRWRDGFLPNDNLDLARALVQTRPHSAIMDGCHDSYRVADVDSGRAFSDRFWKRRIGSRQLSWTDHNWLAVPLGRLRRVVAKLLRRIVLGVAAGAQHRQEALTPRVRYISSRCACHQRRHTFPAASGRSAGTYVNARHSIFCTLTEWAWMPASSFVSRGRFPCS